MSRALEGDVRTQVLRPPYIYRWSVLFAVLTVTIWLVVAVLPGSAERAPERAAAVPTAGRDEKKPVSTALVHETSRRDRVVGLTFDDGPHPLYTPLILDLLDRYDAVGTFCMVGAQVARFPELAREVAERSMPLCNHTQTHDQHLNTRSVARIESEISDCADEMLDAVGPRPTAGFFRAPAGRWSDRMRQVAARHGMRSLSWSIDSRDWERPGVSEIVATIRRDLRPGAVILFHDGGGQRHQTVAALAQLLPWLVEQGYGFDVPA